MSWDADLIFTEVDSDHPGGSARSWNVTHNINPMIERALERAGAAIWLEQSGVSWWSMLSENAGNGPSAMGRFGWWKLLDGRTGPEGMLLIERIIEQLEQDPATFRTMDPENGWGSYDTLLPVLRQMVAAVKEAGERPTHWSTSG